LEKNTGVIPVISCGKRSKEIDTLIKDFQRILRDPKIKAEIEAAKRRDMQSLTKKLDKPFTI